MFIFLIFAVLFACLYVLADACELNVLVFIFWAFSCACMICLMLVFFFGASFVILFGEDKGTPNIEKVCSKYIKSE